MTMNVSRFQCPDCGHETDLAWFGTPHHSGLACVECDTNMEHIGDPTE